MKNSPPSKKPTKKAGKKKSSGKHSGKKFVINSDKLPEICVLVVSSETADGELLATPLDWKSHKAPPHISVLESGRGKAAAIGDRILVKLRNLRPGFYQASIIRVL